MDRDPLFRIGSEFLADPDPEKTRIRNTDYDTDITNKYSNKICRNKLGPEDVW